MTKSVSEYISGLSYCDTNVVWPFCHRRTEIQDKINDTELMERTRHNPWNQLLRARIWHTMGELGNSITRKSFTETHKTKEIYGDPKHTEKRVRGCDEWYMET